MNKLPLSICLIGSFFASCASEGSKNLTPLNPPKVYPITAPAAGNYPQGLFKYPYRAMSLAEEDFTQTLEWSPKVEKTFAADTQYTAVLTLAPVMSGSAFIGTTLEDISGLPSDGVETITAETDNRNLVIRILFEKTSSVKAQAQIIFSDDFEGTSLNRDKWEECPEWDRQGRSSWRDNMVSVSGGMLHLKFVRNAPKDWILCGAIRSRKKNGSVIFENSYGFYESRIKFPQIEGTWGAFWLMSPTQHILSDEGIDGTEIDIVETINNHEKKYNAAIHWNGYGSQHKSAGSGEKAKPVNIYDGEFHTFALDWSPSEYVFYVDGHEFWRVNGGAAFKNSGINQNPNYIKLTVESAEWAGSLPNKFKESEMLVDYVRVYNQPQIAN